MLESGIQGGEAIGSKYVCTPTLKVFCRNIHVGCAGRTAIPTAVFTLHIQGKEATVTSTGSGTSERGVALTGRDLMIRFPDGRSWIRVEPDGKFSQRIYPDTRAAMSAGHCKRLRIQTLRLPPGAGRT